MKKAYSIESETNPLGRETVWATTGSVNGVIRVSVMVNTSSETGREILSTGMFYLSGPGLSGNTLFRIESSRRSVKKGVMYITAVNACDPVRCHENEILRAMSSILDLGSCEEPASYYSRAC